MVFKKYKLFYHYNSKSITNPYKVCNTVSIEQFPINPAVASFINIHNHSVSVKYRWPDNKMQVKLDPLLAHWANNDSNEQEHLSLSLSQLQHTAVNTTALILNITHSFHIAHKREWHFNTHYSSKQWVDQTGGRQPVFSVAVSSHVLAHALPTTIQNTTKNQARKTAQFLAVHMRTCPSERDNNYA